MIKQGVLTFQGRPIDTNLQSFGELRPSEGVVTDTKELRHRFQEDGYLYLPGYLNRELLLDARREMLKALQVLGYVDNTYPLMDGVSKMAHGVSAQSMRHLPKHNAPLLRALYEGRMIEIYERLLGGSIRHLDFTWCRIKPSGAESATTPHYDIVYMGRGTKNLCTSWTPLGDVPKEMGGLMILENSHRQEEIKATYGTMDVDAQCTNPPIAAEIASSEKDWRRHGTGTYASDAIALQKRLNSRWLTTDYQLGDLLIFSMYTLHASLDNQTNRLRLSTDTRYQLASEPVDERWIGDNPIAHGPAAKKDLIC
ncbi:MAG: phytanoyl-CoA dioxygenase family protein [Chloroflexota bacterium]